MRKSDLARIRYLVIAQTLTAALAITGLVIALIALSVGLGGVQTSRHESRLDSCHLLRRLALESASPNRRPAVQLFLEHSELGDCTRYARDLSGER